MRSRRAATVLVCGVVSATAVLAACDSGDDGDLARFCSAYRDLADNNPFIELTVASPGEIRTAFQDLRDAAAAMDRAAPEGLERLADDYASAIDTLEELLDTAEFDPRYLDTGAYRRATIDYEAAATALANETTARCE